MKLRNRFLFPMMIVLALGLTVFASTFLIVSYQTQIQAKRNEISREINSIAYTLQTASTNYTLQNLDVDIEALEEIAKDQGANIMLCENTDADVIRIFDQKLTAQKFLPLGNRNYLLTIETDLSALYVWRISMLKWYSFVYVASIIFLGIALTLIAKHITQPISVLTKTCTAIANGDLSMRADVQSNDESGLLAQAFNRMADELADRIARQKTFINDLTHEMKTPLTAMIGHAEAIRNGRMTTEETVTAAQIILHEGKRLNNLSQTMTEWILLQQSPPIVNRLRVHFLFESVSRTFSNEKQKIEIAENAQETLIYGNQVLLMTLLTNLVKNALNAGANRIILDSFYCGGSIVQITVSDDGCGMNASELAHITEPFYRIDKARSRANGGVGLGLALCKEIIEMHQGTMEFQSTPGQGTKVILNMNGTEVALGDETDPSLGNAYDGADTGSDTSEYPVSD